MSRGGAIPRVAPAFDPGTLEERVGRAERDVEKWHTAEADNLRRNTSFEEKIAKLRGSRRTEQLRALGLDVDELTAGAKEVRSLQDDELQRFLAGRPDTSVDRSKNLMVRNALLGHLAGPSTGGGQVIQVVMNPPIACGCSSGGGDNVACVPQLSEIDIKGHSSDEGGFLGLGAVGVLPTWAGLYFCYLPPVNGNFVVSLFPEVAGSVFLTSDDSWYNRCAAMAQLELKVRLNNSFYWDAWTSQMIINEDFQNGTKSYNMDDFYWLQTSTSVVAGQWVTIYFEADLTVLGIDCAVADLDFSSGADRFVRVPTIWGALFQI